MNYQNMKTESGSSLTSTDAPERLTSHDHTLSFGRSFVDARPPYPLRHQKQRQFLGHAHRPEALHCLVGDVSRHLGCKHLDHRTCNECSASASADPVLGDAQWSGHPPRCRSLHGLNSVGQCISMAPYPVEQFERCLSQSAVACVRFVGTRVRGGQPGRRSFRLLRRTE